MTGLSNHARTRIAQGLGPGVAVQLEDFLRSGEGQLTHANPHLESASHALMLWSVRAENAEMTGVGIEGIQDLVRSLRSLDPETLLERYDSQYGRALLTVYREPGTKRPVGYQFVNAPKPDMDAVYEALGVHLTPSQRSPGPSVKRIHPTKEKLRHA
jgi:hypothetical protein